MLFGMYHKKNTNDFHRKDHLLSIYFDSSFENSWNISFKGTSGVVKGSNRREQVANSFKQR